MKFQLLIAVITLGFCSGLTIQREQRKFIYQDGHPSVRRYPVYPDRHSSLEQELPSVLKDIKNELEEEPSIPLPTEAPLLSKFGSTSEVSHDEEPSTDMSLTMESESTSTTPAPVTTSQTPFPDSTMALDTAPLIAGGFSFTPKPISILEDSPSSLFTPEGDFPRDTFLLPDPITHDGSFFIGNAPVANDGGSFFHDAPSSVAFGAPDTFFNEAHGEGHGVFTEADARPVDTSLFPSNPAFRVPALPPSFGIFTGPPEDSTDIPMTTVMANNFLTDEEGVEEVSNATISPLEERLESFSENVTEVPLLEETVTETEWESATQDFIPTEETGIF